MTLNSFELSNDKKSLEINIADASNIDSLLLFTDKTFKDYNEALDFSNLLTTDDTQTINITPSSLGVKNFEGLYFIELENSQERINGLLSVLTRFEECILEKVVKINLCDDCLKKQYLPLVNAQTTLEGIKIATEFGFIEEAIALINSIKNYCSNKCKSCGNYDNVINNNYLSYND
jgi:hypothetical protein